MKTVAKTTVHMVHIRVCHVTRHNPGGIFYGVVISVENLIIKESKKCPKSRHESIDCFQIPFDISPIYFFPSFIA